MPWSPKRIGAKPQPTGHNWRPRGTTKQRGYGGDWRRLRDLYLQQNGLCERCRQMNRLEPAVEVHHKRKFQGVHDPLRLDWENLISVCQPCHRAMERERKGRR